MTERELFIAALQIADDTQRQAYLTRACGDDADLRRRVGALLAAFNQAGSFLQPQPQAPEPGPTIDPPPERPGMQVGPYKLIQQIGEGGMGTVWMAQQSAPVKRMVAIKLIKAGLDSHQVIARFEAERQALALMDHANIARVLDAGATPAGRPYFVMDLVRGVPITRYCDEHHLTPRERLELFIPVCQAVQHAHQKGIIHRDLKPSNVLVAQYDGRPVPKVIDFGVAKAAGQSLTDKTLVTGFGAIVGTLEYMSPEQAEADQLDIDTRSDIYSLGVLLYELLTGSTPFSRKDLEKAGMLEMLRVIREKEPSKPSTKLSTAEGLPTLAANRGTEPARLTKMVRGELDWIVMKALEKDRNRRYETANGFALDVQRYLADEHVLACPPSAGYRLRKFVRRNKSALATAALVAAALVLGTTVSVWQAVRATNALQAEKKARRDAELATEGEKKQRGVAQQQTTLAQKNAAEAEGHRQRAEANFGKARKAVEEYLTKITENELLRVPGLQPLREDLLKAALKFYAEFTQERAGDPTLRQELASAQLLLARIQRELGNAKAAQAANLESIRLYEQLRTDEQRAPIAARVGVQAGLAAAYFFAGRYDDTVTLCEAILKVEPKHAEIRSLLSDTHNQLANDHDNKKEIAAALARHRLAFDLREGLVRDFPKDPRYLAQLSGTVNNLGNLLAKQERDEEALAMYERAAAYATQACQLAPHSILWSQWLCIQVRNTGNTQARLGRQEDALRSYERVVSVSRKRVFENPAIGALRGDLYQAYLGLGKYQKQVGDAAGSSRNFHLAREVLEQIPRETPDQLFDLASVYSVLSASPADVADPTASDAAERQQHADLAVATLKRAIDAGYKDVRELQSSKDLDPLRNRQDFQEILAAAQKIAEANQRLARANSSDATTKLANSKQAAELLQGLAAGQSRHRTTLAATLHSIGMIQTGLKQFAEAEQSLSQALQLRQELLREPAGSLQPRVDVLATRTAIGQLYWESDRPEEAHRLWQDILAECRQAAADQAQDAALHAGLAGVVWSIAQKYGEAGLWELALPPLEQGLQSQQLVDVAWDCRGAHVLAALGRLEEHRKFCELLAAKWGKNNPPHVVWAATMNPQPAVEIKRLLELADTAIKNSTDRMANFMAATAYYHAGQYQRALELMLPFREKMSDGGSAYQHWLALVYHKLDQKEEAARYFEQAEARYLYFADKCLKSPAKSAAHTGHGNYWWAWAEDQAARQLAWHELRGPGKLRDPWQHLISARGYRLIGEQEKYNVELAAAEALAPGDSEFWIARARLAEQLAEQDRWAEAAWQRAIDAASDKPLPWIHRGRWYAQRGEQAKADADFAKAASLSTETLNKFLQAGWWVAGPYPKGLKEFCPPEVDPDPSRPVHFVDPKTGLSEQPLAWRPAPSDETGKIELRAMFNADQISAYALNILYSPAERPATLRVSADGGLRLWLNGELVYEADPAPTWQWTNEGLIPVTLRPGRNLVVVKVSQSTQKHSFSLRVSDEAVDRAFMLAEWGLWQEAAEQMALAAPSGGFREDSLAVRHAELLLAANDVDGYRRYRAWMLQQFARLGIGPASSFARTCALVPAESSEMARLIQLAEKGLDPKSPNSIGNLGYALYRGGRYDEAIARLREITGHRLHDLVLAMALWRHGDQDAARQLLAKSQAVYDQETRKALAAASYKRPLWNWRDFACFQVLHREARALIEGTAAAGDENAANLQTRARAEFARREALTADFDQALLVEPKQPRHWLARGRRLAELGRFDEAQADFNKAVELSPKDPDVLAARAVFLADRGESAKAAADFNAALRQFDDDNGARPRWRFGVPIDLEVAQRDDVFDRMNAEQLDRRLLMTRIVVRMEQGDVDGARSNARRLTPNGWAMPPAAVNLWLGNQQQFERIRDETPRSPKPEHNVILLGLAPTAEPLTAELLKEAERMWQENPKSRWHQRWLGLAQLRAGQYGEAAANLEASLAGDNWQNHAITWPLLAMAHHHLGNKEAARRWLDRTTKWQELRGDAESRRVGAATGSADILPEDLLYAMVFDREARSLIDGPDAARTERERLAALARHRNQVILAKADAARQGSLAKVEAARQLNLAKAEAAWNHAVELAGNNPLPWIQRGRWYAERGEQAKADADFAKAAALTPGELSKFLEAGWWVVGPYPSNLDECYAPQFDPDPSRPVHVDDPKTGLSDRPVAWQQATVDLAGRIQMPDALQSAASVYALALVYSPDERTALARVGGTTGIRVWCNGQLVFGSQRVAAYNIGRLRVPLALHRGLNRILLRFEKDRAVTFSLGDAPLDRFSTFAETGLWQEAADEILRKIPREKLYDPELVFEHALAVQLAVLCGDRDILQREGDRLLARALTDNQDWTRIRSASALLLVDSKFVREHGGELEASLQERLTRKLDVNQQQRTVVALAELALLQGRTAEAEELMSRREGNFQGNWRLPLWVILRQQQGNAVESRSQLEQALQVAARNQTDYWPLKSWFLIKLREAERLTLGSTQRTDALIARQQQAARAAADQRDPATAAFDLLASTISAEARGKDDPSYPYIAHGRRLAELGRFDEAATDFNEALKLKPDDTKPLTVRARYYAQRGDVERALADFRMALDRVVVNADESYARGLEIGRELASDDAVFAKAVERWPDDYRIWLGRSVHHAELGAWPEAAADNAKAKWPRGFYILRTMERACLQYLAGDLDGYRQTCQGLIAEEASAGDETLIQVRRGILVACGIAPEGSQLVPNLVARAEQLPPAEAVPWINVATALALYRAGRFDEARVRCETPLLPSAWQDQRLALACLRAMCLHQLGRPDEAGALLQAVQSCVAPPGAVHNLNLSKNGAPEQTMRLVRQALYVQTVQLIAPKNP